MKDKIIKILDKHSGSDVVFPKSVFPNEFEQIADEIIAVIESRHGLGLREPFPEVLENPGFPCSDPDCRVCYTGD